MGNVILRERDHKYINLDNLAYQYTSVTRILGTYEQPFDAQAHSLRISLRDNIPQQEILDKWLEINRVAIEYGNRVHHLMERFLLNKQGLYIPCNEFERHVILEFDKLKMITDHRILRPEYVVTYDVTDKEGLSGCGDVIEDISDTEFNLGDFKTNVNLTYNSRFGDWMKFPLRHLSQNNYNTDCLQLSTYAYFYELETGKKVNRLTIFYWDRGDDMTCEVGSWKALPVPYMKTDVKNMINHFTMNMK